MTAPAPDLAYHLRRIVERADAMAGPRTSATLLLRGGEVHVLVSIAESEADAAASQVEHRRVPIEEAFAGKGEALAAALDEAAATVEARDAARRA